MERERWRRIYHLKGIAKIPYQVSVFVPQVSVVTDLLRANSAVLCRSFRHLSVGFALLVVIGCTVRGNPLPASRIDWATAPIVQLRLSLSIFRPGQIILHVGQPVRLVFVNSDGRTHDFVTNFFNSTSQRAGIRQGGIRVILQAADKIECDVVPLIAGDYSVSSVMYVTPGSIGPAEIIVK